LLSPQRRIDAVCDRFETDWRASLAPRIEDHLLRWWRPERRELLGEFF
jgi:hypothetical protein